MSPTRKKGRRHSPTDNQKTQRDRKNGNTNGNGAKPASTVEEMKRLKVLRELYLEPSDDESELSIDSWEDGVYEVDKIVDESVDMLGCHKYQVTTTSVQWKDWKRKSDGTNTTWVKPEILKDGAREVLEEWAAEKKRRIIERREKYAKTGYPLSLFTHGCFTRFNTTLEELGLGEDQELTPDMMFPSYLDNAGSDWDKEVEEAKKIALARIAQAGTYPREDSPLQPTLASLSGGMDFESTPRGPRAPSHQPRASSSSTTNYVTPMSTPQGDYMVPEAVLTSPQTLKRPASRELPSSPPAHTPKRPRKGKERVVISDRTALQEAWDRATDQDGAARVVIVNEVDNEMIPASVDIDAFQYLERGPYRHDGTLTSHASFLTGCMCEDGCTDPNVCHCQGEEHAEPIWEGGERVFGYDEQGKYRFPRVAVVECNDNCQCDWSCPNRVAQRPRDVPLEVFKIEGRGWGVRATVFIAKGKVLGTFTGDLRPSFTSDNEQKSRSKDPLVEMDYELDWFSSLHQWRVTAKDCGNWSRFLNHSCYPNVKVYTVLYDSVMNAAEDNRHRLGFVALHDIEPYTELTVNYWPQVVPEEGDECCRYRRCKRPE